MDPEDFEENLDETLNELSDREVEILSDTVSTMETSINDLLQNPEINLEKIVETAKTNLLANLSAAGLAMSIGALSLEDDIIEPIKNAVKKRLAKTVNAEPGD